MRHPFRTLSLALTGLILVLGPSAASAQGTIDGTVAFWGDPGGGTQIEVAAHSDPTGPPDATVFVAVPGGAYSIPVPDGTYYVSTLMARDGSFGEPRREDVLVWYDADGDGDWDTVGVSGGAVTGVDVDLGFVYVDGDATGGNNGSSWTDAFTDLQDGIDLAVSGIEVWVAEATYVPGPSRADSFLPKIGVRVFGGFAGGETVRQQRDWIAHPTILSCEIGAAAATDNCYHVIRAEASNPTAMFNGLTITRGYANGGAIDNEGGGVRARGGGVTLANVTLADNFATTGGGVMVNLGGTVRAYNCRFVNNQAPGFEGGGFYGSVTSAQPLTIVNCVFTGNSAWRGGGIALTNSGLQPVLVNLSLSGNSAGGEGGGIYVNTSSPFTVHNSILWGNTGPNPQISAYRWGRLARRQLQHRPGRMDPRRHSDSHLGPVLRRCRAADQPRLARHRLRRQHRGAAGWRRHQRRPLGRRDDRSRPRPELASREHSPCSRHRDPRQRRFHRGYGRV